MSHTNTPTETKLRQYVAAGLTQQEMVEQHLADTGITCTRSAIAMKMTRLSIPAAHPAGFPHWRRQQPPSTSPA